MIWSFVAFLYPIKPYHNMTNSQNKGNSHVYCHDPILSASIPCSTGKTAPPKTPIMKIPEAFEVYSFKPSTERVNIQLHITLWKSPTAAISHRFSVSSDIVIRDIAASVTVISIGRGATFFNPADTVRPTRKPPQ